MKNTITQEAITKKYNSLNSESEKLRFMQNMVYKIVDINYGGKIEDFNILEKPNPGQIISGTFETPRMGGKRLIIGFDIDNNKIILFPKNIEVLNHSEEGETYYVAMLIALSFSEKVNYFPLEFFNFAQKQMNCTKGWSCKGPNGFGCLSQSKKNCNNTLSPVHTTYAAWLADKIPKDSAGMVRAARIAHYVAGSYVPGGVVTAKIMRAGANIAAKKITGEKASVKEEIGHIASELTGSHIGQFVGHLIGGFVGGAIGQLMGYAATDGIKHVRKVAADEKAKLAKDDIFNAASGIGKVKMTGSAIAKGLKQTAKEHHQDLKDTTIAWGAATVAGVFNNDIITIAAGEYLNPTDLKRAKEKLTTAK